MPIYVGYSQKRRTIRVLSAGGTQYWLCPPTDIELLATLSDDFNLRNITLTWEQIKGPPVTLASTDTLATSFPFADTEDKTFRFWVDKDTNRAQYKDVNIFYTPTSIMQERVMNSGRSEQSFTTPNLTQTPTFLLDEPSGEVNSNVLLLPASLITFDPQPLEELQKSIKFEILTDPGYVVNPEVIYATYDYAAGEYVYSIPLPNGVYKFRFYYDHGEFGYDSYTSDLIIINNTATVDDAWAAETVYHGNVGLNSELVSITKYTIRKWLGTSIHQDLSCFAGLVGANGQHMDGEDYNTSIVRLVPRLVNETDHPELVMTHNLAHGLDSTLELLSRLDPSNIGND